MNKRRGKAGEQKDLFLSPTAAPKPEPKLPPSDELALFMVPIIGPQRQKLLDYLRSRGEQGATVSEIARDLQSGSVDWGLRMLDLIREVLIRDSGQTRLNTFGANEVVWVAVKRG